MAIRTAHALILRRWNFRETSVILSVFTDSAGKFHGLIKGFYDRPPRYGPAMVGSLNTVVFYESARQQLLLISQCDLKDPLLTAGGNARVLHPQSRILELLEQGTVERDPHPELFSLALQALRTLAAANDPDGVVRLFEVKFLKLLGLSPSVEDCVVCGVVADAHSALSLKHGGLLCPRCAGKDHAATPLLPGTLATLQHLLTRPWETTLRLQWTRPVRAELDRLLDRFIAFHIEARFKTRPPVAELAYAHT